MRRVTSSGAHLESFDRIIHYDRYVSGILGLLSLVHWSCSLNEGWDMFSKDPSG